MTDNWFKAEVLFACPHCGQRSSETLIANASRHNPAAVAEGIRKAVAPLTCQRCKKLAPEGIRYDIGMNDLKPEDVSKLNLTSVVAPPPFAPSKSCPCGLFGKTYGECCKDKGMKALGNAMLSGTSPVIVPGARTEILSSMVMGDTRFRILWNELWHSPQEQTFHQFLDSLVLKTLGQNWFEQQKLLPVKNQNAIVRWRTAMTSLLNKPGDADDAVGTGHTLTGPVKAYPCFGHDLYWLQLVHRLPESLIERLKDFQAFQGARYEVMIAAVFARAGFGIEWIDDTKVARKHPEFIATHKKTKEKVGVETKSRRRPGAMNYIGMVTPETHLKGDVFELYEKAVQQAPAEGLPFLIFIDPNVPASFPKDVPAYSDIPVETFPWMTEIRDRLVSTWNGSIEPSAESAVFVTNFAFYYGNEEDPSPTGMGSFFPSVKPRVSLLGNPMIEDLIYCLRYYDQVPRQL
ncbi:MAG: hypothetical protein WBO19_00040 [Terriglobia bacterium]|jgi:hypothetical protein